MTNKSKAFERLLRRFRLMKDSLATTHSDWNRFIVQCISQGFSIEEVKEHIKQQDEERRRRRMEKEQNKVIKGAETGRFSWNEGDTIEDKIATSSMQCLKCGKHLTAGKHNYFTIKGNIFIGEDNNIIGGTPDSVSRFCVSCFMDMMEQHVDDLVKSIRKEIEDKEAQLNDLIGKETPDLDIPEFLQ